MSKASLQVLAVSGSMHAASSTLVASQYLTDHMRRADCNVDLLDLLATPLPIFNPDSTFKSGDYAALKSRVERADVLVLGTPDYHGSVSGVMKNFLDHFWREFAGKLFVTLVASHEKGLTVHDQLRTVARQCYAWTLPYGISLQEKEDVRDGQVASEAFRARLEMAARDAGVYGILLRDQRAADLSGTDPCFMARHRR